MPIVLSETLVNGRIILLYDKGGTLDLPDWNGDLKVGVVSVLTTFTTHFTLQLLVLLTFNTSYSVVV